MALNIKNREVEELVNEVARITGESKTEAVRRALEERRARLRFPKPDRNERARRWLEEVWASLPPDVRGRRITKEEREEILGYGPLGV